MNTIINLALKFSGLSWIWEKVDGYKTKGAAIVGILTGLLGVIQELAPAISAHDAGAVFAVLRALPHDPSWLTLVGGFLGLGIGHKLEKAADAPAAPPAA